MGEFKKSGQIGAGGLGGKLWGDKWSKLEHSRTGRGALEEYSRDELQGL